MFTDAQLKKIHEIGMRCQPLRVEQDPDGRAVITIVLDPDGQPVQ